MTPPRDASPAAASGSAAEDAITSASATAATNPHPPPPPQPSAASSSAGRRLLSRIASPFSAAGPRAVADFSVAIDDELRQFSPGDLVAGSVTVRVVRPTRITHIVVCLHGYVQVFRNVGVPGQRHRPSTARHQRSGASPPVGRAVGLFEDESVLCGDGRLTEGTYVFRFELEFPDHDLPSSIDFERGTVSYMVTATLTRPAAISPVLVTDRKLYYIQRIDISDIPVPPSRTITLEPVSRRAKVRNPNRRLVETDKIARKVDSARASGDPTPPCSVLNNNGTDPPASVSGSASLPPPGPSPASPALSELSFDDTLGTPRFSQSESQYQPSLAGSDGTGLPGPPSLSANRVITATVEPDRGGCLRGDSVTVTVSVSHTKHVKSLYGVIVTLYRHARVDLQADKSQAATERGTRSGRHEDYYPRSLTGLSGLSLSGAGSIHAFRKDLSQVMVPLMVDPHTLSTEVTAKVRVPDDAFPTISNVPGAMISFRYYVEAVVDIQGKLPGLHGISSLASPVPEYVVLADASDQRDRSSLTNGGGPVVDTAAIRRDRGVVTCSFEIIVGTRDSERRRGKRRVIHPAPDDSPPVANTLDQPRQHVLAPVKPPSLTRADLLDHDAYARDEDPSSSAAAYWHRAPGYSDPSWYAAQWYMHPDHPGAPHDIPAPYAQHEDGGPVHENSPHHIQNQWHWHGYWWNGQQYMIEGAVASPTAAAPTGAAILPPPLPLPEFPDESQMSEKERMRAAESRLLPSQPPAMALDEADSSSAVFEHPSAPYLPEEILGSSLVASPHGHGPVYSPAFIPHSPSAPCYETSAAASSSAHHLSNSQPTDYAPATEEPSAPTLEDFAAETVGKNGPRNAEGEG